MTRDNPSLECVTAADGCVLKPRGCWCIDHLEQLDHLLNSTPVPHDCHLKIDASGLTDLDSAGVMLVVNRLRAQGVVWSNVDLADFNAHQLDLIHLVAERLDARAQPRRRRSALLPLLGRKAAEQAKRWYGNSCFLAASSKL
jgi:ABC-type transporter Mla MlaB component